MTINTLNNTISVITKADTVDVVLQAASIAIVSGGGGSGNITSVSGTPNQITVLPTTGAVVISLSSNVIFPGTWAIGTLGYIDTGILWSAQSSINSYNQVILQNINAGATASANYNVSNNLATPSTFFGEFGINSSGFTGAGIFNQPSYVYLASANTDLVIGTYGANAIHFVVNMGNEDALTISNNNNITIPSFASVGIVHTSITGLLSTSLIISGDVTTNTFWNVGGNILTGPITFGDISATGFTINFQTKAITRLSIDGSGNSSFTQNAQSSSWGKAILFTPGAHTVLTAATEFIDYDFALNRNQQWLAGTTATQRQVYVRGVTLTGASATATFTDAYSLYVDPPVAGPNATITRPWVAGFAGNVLITGTSLQFKAGGTAQIGTFDNTSFQIITSSVVRISILNTGSITFTGSNAANTVFQTFNQGINTSGVSSGLVWNAGAHTNQTLNSEVTDINYNLSAIMKMADGTVATQRAFRIQGRTYTPQTTALTLTEASTLEVNPAIAGAGTTITNNYAIKSTGNVLITGTTLQFKAGGTAQIGSFDNNTFGLYSNSIQRQLIDSNGNIYFGASGITPLSKVDMGGSLGINLSSTSIDITLDNTYYTIKVDASGANRTITLPAASGCSRRIYVIKKIDNSANTVTIDGNATETIDGALTKIVNTQYAGYAIQSDGTNWNIIASF